MKVFLLGAPCAGKTTLIKALREVLDSPLLDMDDELLRLNGGIWPPLELKRRLSSQVIDEASRLGDVVLAYCVSVDTLRRRVAAGELPASRLGRRLIRVRIADLDRMFRPIPNAQWSQPGLRSAGGH
jgi:hypothetical protein